MQPVQRKVGKFIGEIKPPTPAVVTGSVKKHVCGMLYHVVKDSETLCANHSESCTNKRPVSMCFKEKFCDICGFCSAHCVEHRGVRGWTDARTRRFI